MDRKNLFIPLFIIVVLCVDAIMSYNSRCNSVKSQSKLLQLKRHLLCEYDADVRPVQHNNNMTQVKFYIIPHFLEYDSMEETFQLHTWTSMSWNDSHLTWDAAQFDNIEFIIVPFYDLWIPDVFLHNVEIEDNTMSGFAQSKCWVWWKGKVTWVTPTKYSTFCTSDNTWWPYNVMNCSVEFGSWSHSGDEIDLIHSSNLTIDLHDYEKNVEWDLLKVDVTTREEGHKYNLNVTARMISYHFILKRHWGAVRIAYITPNLILMVMTLMTLWLEPKSLERMVITNLNFICHILCMQIMHWEIPKNGPGAPKIITFCESSLGVALFVLILTNILRQLEELTTAPPAWISKATTSLLRSRAGQILLISILDPAATAKIEVEADDNTDLVGSNSKKSPWSYVIILIGWLAFAVVLLAYIVLLITCMPS